MNPTVSIIVPCYNEHATIRQLLDAILAQTYPHDRMEVIISDGLSTDDTRAVISAFQVAHPELSVKIVDNLVRSIPAALNGAIQAARGDILVRLDAHSVPYPDYVVRCEAALEAGIGANVGGVWEVKAGARTWIAESVAAAAAHPLGVGDAQYRLSPQAGAVDTVPFGSFHRSLIDEVGGFDESLLSNEDYEFNARVRAAGRVVWLDPAIRSIYYSRPTLTELAKQYWRYGFWKWRMLQRYRSTLRWRQFLPPLFVLSLAAMSGLAPWFVEARFLLAIELSTYLAILFAAGIAAAIARQKPAMAAGLPLAIGTMHFAWGAGFLWSMLSGLFGK
ncbi:MAG TPA: glycosyltransferase family 2 protein [Anaerolineales bacterium]|jgi:glycosyltransferase involved in cell wall biosynthesis